MTPRERVLAALKHEPVDRIPWIEGIVGNGIASAVCGEAVNVDEMSSGRYLPEGLVAGCRLLRDVQKDAVITYKDVVLPSDRIADRLRAEQYRHFRGETWLEERIGKN